MTGDAFVFGEFVISRHEKYFTTRCERERERKERRGKDLSKLIEFSVVERRGGHSCWMQGSSISIEWVILGDEIEKEIEGNTAFIETKLKILMGILRDIRPILPFNAILSLHFDNWKSSPSRKKKMYKKSTIKKFPYNSDNYKTEILSSKFSFLKVVNFPS